MSPLQGRNTAPQTGGIPLCNTFDWLFSNPFESESACTPRSQLVPRIRNDKPIFIEEASDRHLTYSQLRSDALTLATNLHNRGLDPRDTIALPPTPTCPRPEVAPVVLVQLPNCLAFATAVLGSWAAALTVTLVSPALAVKEVAWVLGHARPRVVITASSCLENMRQAINAQEDKVFFQTVEVFSVDIADYPSPSSHAQQDAGDWKVLLEPTSQTVSPADFIPPEAVLSRTAVMFWSSGTSGRSKGVLLSHHALNFSVSSLWHDADFYQGRPQRCLAFIPFFHVFGLTNIFLLTIATGSTAYTISAFKLDTVLKAIPRRKITYLHIAPPVAVILAKSPAVEPYAKRDKDGNNAFSSVVAGVTGGAPLGHETVVQVYERLGIVIRLGYGMSEACSVTVQRGLGEADMRAWKNDTGKLHFGVELMIAADGDGPQAEQIKSAPTGSPGEILIRSPGLMMAYLPSQGLAHSGVQPDMSATYEALTKDGWLRTGDVGTLDADGNLCITDRIKEMIKVRAFQVAPAELEALLCSSNDVADAGVVGVHHDGEATEYPRAFVVPANPNKTKPELVALAHQLKALVEEHTARYKWLVGGIVFVPEIPKSQSGKILRRLIKEGRVQGGFEVALYQQRQKRPQKL